MLRRYKLNPDTGETKQTEAAAVLLHNCVCQQVVPAIPAPQRVGFTNRMSNKQNSPRLLVQGPAARVKLAVIVYTVCI